MKNTAALALGVLLLTGASAMAAEPQGRAPDDAPMVPHPAAARPVQPKYQFLFNAPTPWTATYRWRYNHQGAPDTLANNRAGIVTALQSMLARWTSVCGIDVRYEGETTIAPNQRIFHPVFGEQPDGESVVGWGDPGQAAALTYSWAAGGVEMFDADVVINPAQVRSIGVVQTAMAHEWGHAIGLGHSDVSGAVMSGPPDTAYTGLSVLASDDIRGCRCRISCCRNGNRTAIAIHVI